MLFPMCSPASKRRRARFTKRTSDKTSIGCWQSREESLALMHEWTASESLRKHMLAIEAAMVAYAQKFGEEAALWGATGLLHDFDYEKCPTVETHVLTGIPILAEAGYPAPMLDAILGARRVSRHPARNANGENALRRGRTVRLSHRRCLCASTQSLAGIEFSSINKKLKDKAFARPVNRDQLRRAAAELGVDFQEHALFVTGALENM
jgi:predicted hydrolase (HD superfamily)